MSEPKRITISLDENTFNAIEDRRGLVPRSKFISTILSKVLVPKEA